ncbi:hypothetical protein [Aminobacter aminovorans]|uniref:hypothetical protein n=1 Tax=Aminobacter aminovorans TaxID=83263 RepID=UPI00285E8DF3|nr:hypothetical protein [Aminobacter aminovorans]MDR7220324.1 hypothetical protein [Aminobacter aminovorans]
MTSEAAWKIEEARQSQELCDAIQSVINEHGLRLKSEGRVPIMNAVASALVSVQGGMLAAIEDPRHRKALRNAMERNLPRAIAQMMGRSGKAEVFNIRGPKQ